MPGTDTINIHHIEGRRSFRVIWLCEELGLPYTLSLKPGDIFGSLMAIREAYPAMPVAPVVEYGDQWIVETGAILDVILAHHGDGRLVPDKSSPDFISHCQWMHFAEGSAASRMLSERFVALTLGVNPDELHEGYRQKPSANPPAEPAGPPQLAFMVGSRCLFDFMEDHLSAHPYFGGADFSAADIMMHFPIQVARLIAWIDTSQYQQILRWQKQVEQRPAFKAALARANPSGADEFGQPLNEPPPFPPRPAA
jgi:glutathione S-transferase